MHAVVRRYQNAAELIALMGARADEVERVIGSTPGFLEYHAMRDGDALTTITICQDKTGTDESSRLAAAWVKENLSADALKNLMPQITEADTFIDFGTPQRLGTAARA
jgi:hypothetical protein